MQRRRVDKCLLRRTSDPKLIRNRRYEFERQGTAPACAVGNIPRSPTNPWNWRNWRADQRSGEGD